MELILGVAVAMTAAVLAGRHWPLREATGGGLVGIPDSPAVRERSFTVCTYNIHRGRGLDGKRDLSRIAQMIEGYDLIGMQEVEGPGLRSFRDQASQLGEQCGYAVHFSPTRRRCFFPHRGNALLSRLPVTSWHREPLSPTVGKAFRNLTVYRILINGQAVHVMNTHLSKPEEQSAPLHRVLEVLQGFERVVLLGDFNARPEYPALQQLLDSGFVDAISVSDQDSSRVDWILVRGLRVQWARSEPAGPSDHPFYTARLSFD